MGRRLLCAPYFSTACLAATLIAETAREDSQAGPLAAIVEGRMRFGVAIADGDWTLAAQGLHAALDAQDWRLSGEAAAVIDGASADTLLDRKGVVSGKSVSVRVDLGARRCTQKQSHHCDNHNRRIVRGVILQSTHNRKSQ